MNLLKLMYTVAILLSIFILLSGLIVVMKGELYDKIYKEVTFLMILTIFTITSMNFFDKFIKEEKEDKCQ